MCFEINHNCLYYSAILQLIDIRIIFLVLYMKINVPQKDTRMFSEWRISTVLPRIHGHAHIYVTGHFWRFKNCFVYMGMPNVMRVYGHAHINEIGFRQKIVKTD